MSLPKKMVACSCGYSQEIDRQKDWCDKCGRPVFYEARDKIKNRLNNIFIIAAIALVFGFIAFLFTEMIAIPMMKLTGAG